MTSKRMKVKSETVLTEGPRTYTLQHLASTEEAISPEEFFEALDAWSAPRVSITDLMREVDRVAAPFLETSGPQNADHPNDDDEVSIDGTYWARVLRWRMARTKNGFEARHVGFVLEDAFYLGQAYARLSDYGPLPDQSYTVAEYAERGFQQTLRSSKGGQTSAKVRTTWKAAALRWAFERRREFPEITQDELAYEVQDALTIQGHTKGFRTISQLLADAIKSGDLPPRTKKSRK